jgi:transposase
MILPCPLPGCAVDRVIRSPDQLVIVARRRRGHGRCPSCGTPSSAVHSRYERHPADLPSFGQAVRLRVRVRRFYCHHPSCRRRTFAEPLPKLLQPRARRTRRLARAQGRVGLALGGEAGARLLPHLAMATSPDTVLRLVRCLPLPAPEAPRVVGIDDWAMRKGRTYGTILVDLERRRPVDLLPDRSGAAVAAWLRRRPQIAIVARDRSTEYARAATAGLPGARQVADRWHLLLNMRQAVERWLARTHGRLRRLPPPSGGDDRRPGQRLRAYRRSEAEIAASADSHARWLAAYQEVRRRHQAGETLLAIGRATGLARGTVRKYAHAETFPERAVRRPNPSRLDPHLAHLERRMAEGCEDAMALWREARDQGFVGTHRQVHRFVAERRTAPARRTARKWLGHVAPTRPGPSTTSPLPSPKQLAWLMVQPVAALSSYHAAAMVRVEQDVEAARVADLARRFTALVRGCGLGRGEPRRAPCGDLDAWLGEARACGVRAVETFAAGLAQDEAAVRAALTTPWSNGQAEGQVTRLKMLKRTMYGRAGFDLLRRRVLLAA